MNTSKEAIYISKKTKENLGLIYQTPREVQRAIDNDRALIFYNQDKPTAFCLWNFFGEWCEVIALYAEPEVRKTGILEKVHKDMLDRLGKVVKKVFVFTRHPAVARLVRSIGFKKASVWKLPWIVIFKLIYNRLDLRRLLSYTKFGFKFSYLNWKMYIWKSPL